MQIREKESSEAYLKSLQSNGASAHALYLRSRFLDTFIKELNYKEHSREGYAAAIQKARAASPKEEANDMLTVSREYFPFWMNDAKEIAKLEKTYDFNANVPHWVPHPKNLKVLESAVNADIFTIHEDKVLSCYLEKKGIENNNFTLTKERLKLAKVLLVRLRDAPIKSPTFYRTAIDLTLPLFKKKVTQQLYLETAREFFTPWKETPDVYS